MIAKLIKELMEERKMKKLKRDLIREKESFMGGRVMERILKNTYTQVKTQNIN